MNLTEYIGDTYIAVE